MSGLLQRHTLHVIPLVIPVVATAVVLLPDIIRSRHRRLLELSTQARHRIYLCAGASVGAASVHIAVTPEHFSESWLYGVFFVGASVVQLALALWLLARPSRSLIRAAVISNAGLVLLWLLSRSVGIPLGPEQGVVEPVGVLDLMAVGCELMLLTAGWPLLRRPVLANRAPDPATRVVPVG
jgi:hypothetical protein